MSYMRGDRYVYATGKDDDDPDAQMVLDDYRISVADFDELVVMRYAEMQEAGTAAVVELRAMERWSGNVGSWALCRRYGRDPEGDFDRYLDQVREAHKRRIEQEQRDEG